MLSFKQFLSEMNVDNQNQQTQLFDPNTWQYGPSIPQPDVLPRPANQDEIDRATQRRLNPIRRRVPTNPGEDFDGDGRNNIYDPDDDNDGIPDDQDPWPFDPWRPEWVG